MNAFIIIIGIIFTAYIIILPINKIIEDEKNRKVQRKKEEMERYKINKEYEEFKNRDK